MDEINQSVWKNQISEKQQRSLVESTAKINIWEGAVRSGKTFISLWRFLDELIHGPEGEYVIITRTYDSFKRNLFGLLCNMIGIQDARLYLGKREMHIYGKMIHIVGADDERAETKIRGATFAGAYVDEITIIPESVWQMLVTRCAMHGARIFGTTNPDSPYHWLKKNYLNGDNEDVRSWQFTLDDNPMLPAKDKEYLKRRFTGLWYRRFIEGQWVQAENAIYDCFDPKLHVLDYYPQEAPEYYVGVDYGTTNPCAFVLVGVNRAKFPNLWVEAEYYYDSKKHMRQKSDMEYAQDLKRFISHKNVRTIVVDPSAVSFRVECRKQGIEGLKEAKNEVLDGIRHVNNLINSGTLKFTPGCKHLIEEMQSYVWDEKSVLKGIDQPKKENDHALDALRYIMYTIFPNGTNKEDQIDWDAIYRETRGLGQNLPEGFFRDDQNRYYG